ncbi:hypothetical protein [Streptomyces nigra]
MSFYDTHAGLRDGAVDDAVGDVTAAQGSETHREYIENDLFWSGLVTFRDAGLGIADLREFVAMLRADPPPSRRARSPGMRRSLRQRL